MLKTIVIFNPAAGKGKSWWRWESFERQLSRTFAFETHSTTRAGDAEKLARNAVASGIERILVVGGDGTVNEVVNGVVGSSVAIGIIPFGTGNDLARSLGIPKTDRELLGMLQNPGEIRVNVAKVNHRHFVMATGFGFDALVANYVNTHPFVKQVGPFGYLIAALRILSAYQPSRVSVTVDGNELHLMRAWMIAIGNCPYYGGGMKLFPGAAPDDDLLDICMVANLGKLKVLRIFPLVYTGKHVAKKAHITMLRGRDIRVQGPTWMMTHVDGELLQDSSLEISLCPHRLRFLTAPREPQITQ